MGQVREKNGNNCELKKKNKFVSSDHIDIISKVYTLIAGTHTHTTITPFSMYGLVFLLEMPFCLKNNVSPLFG